MFGWESSSSIHTPSSSDSSGASSSSAAGSPLFISAALATPTTEVVYAPDYRVSGLLSDVRIHGTPAQYKAAATLAAADPDIFSPAYEIPSSRARYLAAMRELDRRGITVPPPPTVTPLALVEAAEEERRRRLEERPSILRRTRRSREEIIAAAEAKRLLHEQAWEQSKRWRENKQLTRELREFLESSPIRLHLGRQPPADAPVGWEECMRYVREEVEFSINVPHGVKAQRLPLGAGPETYDFRLSSMVRAVSHFSGSPAETRTVWNPTVWERGERDSRNQWQSNYRVTWINFVEPLTNADWIDCLRRERKKLSTHVAIDEEAAAGMGFLSFDLRLIDAQRIRQLDAEIARRNAIALREAEIQRREEAMRREQEASRILRGRYSSARRLFF